MNDVSRELGGAIGIAVLGSAFTASYRASIDASGGSLPTGTVDPVRDSTAADFGVTEQAGPDASVVVVIVRSALSDGFSPAMVIATVLLVIGAIYIGLRTPKTITAADDRLDFDPIDKAPERPDRHDVAR